MNTKNITNKTITYSLPLFPLFVVLLVCKVLGFINIGWFWVFLPILIWPIFFFTVLGFILVCFLFVAIGAIIGGMFS